VRQKVILGGVEVERAEVERVDREETMWVAKGSINHCWRSAPAPNGRREQRV
jgi:hypothetical protein